MEHTLPALPYAKDALAPHISAETLEFHHGKHHQAYVTNLNNLIKGTEYENLDLEASRDQPLGQLRPGQEDVGSVVVPHEFQVRVEEEVGRLPSLGIGDADLLVDRIRGRGKQGAENAEGRREREGRAAARQPRTPSLETHPVLLVIQSGTPPRARALFPVRKEIRGRRVAVQYTTRLVAPGPDSGAGRRKTRRGPAPDGTRPAAGDSGWNRSRITGSSP